MKTQPQTDNSNIAVPSESLQDAARNWCKDNEWLAAYLTAKSYGNAMFEGGANWKEQQLLPLIESHTGLKEVAERCKEYLHTKYPNEADIFNELTAAIEKANNITQTINK